MNDGKLVLNAVVYFTTDYSQECDQFEQLEKIAKIIKKCDLKQSPGHLIQRMSLILGNPSFNPLLLREDKLPETTELRISMCNLLMGLDNF